MVHKIDFSKIEKVVGKMFDENARIVTQRLRRKEKRITRQVRVSLHLAKRLKVHATELGRTMSLLLDEYVERCLKEDGYQD